jgi:voltage-gated potassium channel Kch
MSQHKLTERQAEILTRGSVEHVQQSRPHLKDQRVILVRGSEIRSAHKLETLGYGRVVTICPFDGTYFILK